MSEPKFCEKHRAAGQLVAAHRIVDGKGMCDSCWRGIPLSEQPKAAKLPDAAVVMPPVIDWELAQKKRDDGVPVAQIAQDLKLPPAKVYAMTKSLKQKARGESNAVLPPAPKLKSKTKPPARPGSLLGADLNTQVANIVAALRAERDKFARLIEQLEELYPDAVS